MPGPFTDQAEILLSVISLFPSQEQWEAFSSWQHFDSTEDNFCEVDGEFCCYYCCFVFVVVEHYGM